VNKQSPEKLLIEGDDKGNDAIVRRYDENAYALQMKEELNESNQRSSVGIP
jgi:hypothetical protein